MANPRTIARLEARIHERVAHCLQFELSDPRAGFVTVTRVELSGDLSLAKVHWSVLGDAAERSKSEHMLEHATGFVQRQVAGALSMRRAPRLLFVYDASPEQADHLDELIRIARQRDREIDPTLAAREEREAREAEAARQQEAAARKAAREAAEAGDGVADGADDGRRTDEDDA
jgi:ribosome-binding factor A